MFEDSLVESRAIPLSSTKRWTVLASVSLQIVLAAAIITLPLLHPEALPFHLEAPGVFLPLPPKPPAPTVRAEHAAAVSSAAALPAAARLLVRPSILPNRTVAANDAPSLAPISNGMGTPDSLLANIGSGVTGNEPRVVVTPRRPPAGPLSISSGVSQGMLITPIRPVYPAIARAAQVAGSVVIEATISQTGTIESLHVRSGPVLLQSAAIEAIRAARYRPYLLNGQPTAVHTTFTVNFSMTG